MPLPTGTWKINVSWRESDFVIPAIEEGGFKGTLLGQTVTGFWDEVSQTIIFVFRLEPLEGVPVPVVGLPVAVFKAYLFRTPENAAPGHDVVATLTGFAQVNGNVLNLTGNPRRNIFGWLAQIPEVL